MNRLCPFKSGLISILNAEARSNPKLKKKLHRMKESNYKAS